MILPGSMLGMLGGGQLGRMFTLRARAMGYRVTVLDPDADSPAGAVADRHLRAPYDDPVALADLAHHCAAVTTEWENVPARVLERLGHSIVVRPPIEAVAVAQDRILEKEFLRGNGFSTAPFHPIRSAGDIPQAFASLDSPCLLKTSRMGYDGKGQATVASVDAAIDAFERFGAVPCVLESRLALEREISVVLARASD
ncbi:MAG: ATP-grasp domain-containing protein, partial [Gemmatimonadota bacterium]